jgi:hypothetical protein
MKILQPLFVGFALAVIVFARAADPAPSGPTIGNSPYTIESKGGVLQTTGFPPGTEIKDPYTGHIGIVQKDGTVKPAAPADNAKTSQPPEPLAYDSLKAWHKAGGLQGYLWPKEHLADLNDDRIKEVFLGVSGYGRGMTYALFTKTRKGWILLCDGVEGSHHDFDVLPAKHGSWHDFKGFAPNGRGGLFEFIYTWDGRHYVQKSSREIKEKELLGE